MLVWEIRPFALLQHWRFHFINRRKTFTEVSTALEQVFKLNSREKKRSLSACSNFSCIKKVNAKLKSRPEGVVEEQDITYSSCRNAIDRVVVRHFKMQRKVSLIRVFYLIFRLQWRETNDKKGIRKNPLPFHRTFWPLNSKIKHGGRRRSSWTLWKAVVVGQEAWTLILGICIAARLKTKGNLHIA